MKLIIVSGRSGSGKSISLHVLEDLGYYCIDNLPASLLPTLLKHVRQNYDRIAIGIDARNLPTDLDRLHQVIEQIRQAGETCEVIYLDADDNALLKRFSETRRKHPLTSSTVSLSEAIEQEKKLLEPVAYLADLRIDTTHLTLHQLCEIISERVHKHQSKLSLLIVSFGYKFGVPPDSDYVFDVRCLPNPYWLSELRPFDGRDIKIQTFLREQPMTQRLLTSIQQFLDTWIPCYEEDNRNYMTVAIGCTGGQHRSVFIAEQLSEHFTAQGKNVQLRHREL